MNEKEISEIKSILKLLDDDDSTVFTIARNRLLEIGEPALPYLDVEIQEENPQLKERLDEIVTSIAAVLVKEQLLTLKKQSGEDIDLEEAAFIIARYGEPTANMEKYKKELQLYSEELSSRLDLSKEPEEIISTINDFFIQEKNFRGNTENYYNVENQYLHKVIENKKGNPLALCLIYIIVCKKLHLPIFGIGLPGRFIIKFVFGEKEFFIDPFNNGNILSKQECKKYVENFGHTFQEHHLNPVTNVMMIERMLRNLLVAFEKSGDTTHKEHLLEYVDILTARM